MIEATRSPLPMTINYDTFAAMYGSRLPSLTQTQFAAFLPSVVAEVSRYEWGGLLDTATGLLMGHYLSLASVSAASSEGAIESVRVEGEITLRYQKNSDFVGFSTTSFGKEYERLLGLIGGGLGKVASGHYGGNRVDRNPQVWG